MKRLVLSTALLAACSGGDGTKSPGEIPVPVNGIGVYWASLSATKTGITKSGTDFLLSDGSRTLTGWCPATDPDTGGGGSGYVFDYTYTREGDATSGTLKVRACPNDQSWSGSATGETVDHSYNDIAPFSFGGVSGEAKDSEYLPDLTEKAFTVSPGTYESDGFADGGAWFPGAFELDVTILEGNQLKLNDLCPLSTGTYSIPEPTKNLASVSLPDCRGGTVEGFMLSDGDSIYILFVLDNENETYIGWATKP